MPIWKKDDLEKLSKLVKEKQSWQVIATELKRSVEAVRMKARRLGLSVVVERGRGPTTTNDLPEELPSVEEALKVLARVLKVLDQPGLETSEVQRLQAMVSTIRTYESMLASYMRYREIEKRLVELEAKYVRLAGEKA
ncbi:MAG: hypothetical protein OEW62_04665 [Candidatus Bathyarchaeota archaeon]|nr:hypothetical protein [Candidatus Bathyarchaeota archaeon]MDH5746719.1 hypothetical protein [Candidatus Bathyarchaeota archaeon]